MSDTFTINRPFKSNMLKLLSFVIVEFTNDSAELYSVLQKQKNANQRTLLKRTDYKSAPTGFYPNLLKK